MKSVNDIINIFLKDSKTNLVQILDKYNLTVEDIEVYLYNEYTGSITNISEQTREQPIHLRYSVTENKPYSVLVEFSHEKIKKERN